MFHVSKPELMAEFHASKCNGVKFSAGFGLRAWRLRRVGLEVHGLMSSARAWGLQRGSCQVQGRNGVDFYYRGFRSSGVRRCERLGIRLFVVLVERFGLGGGTQDEGQGCPFLLFGGGGGFRI